MGVGIGGKGMREIQYRAWHKDGAYMMPVEEIDFENKLINKSGAWRWFNELELMQSTGLKDKNGVEIFEGDVLYFEPYETHENDRIVQYINGAYRGKLIRSGYSKLLADCVYEAKVIGNIYKNPELLEEKK